MTGVVISAGNSTDVGGVRGDCIVVVAGAGGTALGVNGSAVEEGVDGCGAVVDGVLTLGVHTVEDTFEEAAEAMALRVA